jgi:hypothetical protein
MRDAPFDLSEREISLVRETAEDEGDGGRRGHTHTLSAEDTDSRMILDAEYRWSTPNT